MRIVIALGGNALLQRGEPLEAFIQYKNITDASIALARIAKQHQIILTHGNGPQVGLLALQNDAYKDVSPYPLHTLDAETQGMIGSLFVQALKNELPEREVVCLLTHIMVDHNDLGFKNPTKFVGPVYNQKQAQEVAHTNDWVIKPDGKYFRRVVASPKPQKILELDTINYLLRDDNILIVCAGGGGIPVIYKNEKLYSVDAVIDKDRASSLLANEIKADGLIILSDIEAVETKFSEPSSKKIKAINTNELVKFDFADGSMKPKIESVLTFIENGGNFAAIGELSKVEEILDGKSGTHISKTHTYTQYY